MAPTVLQWRPGHGGRHPFRGTARGVGGTVLRLTWSSVGVLSCSGVHIGLKTVPIPPGV